MFRFGGRRSISPNPKPIMSGIKFIYFPYPQKRRVRNKSRAAVERNRQAFADHWRVRKTGWWPGIFKDWG